MILLTTEIPDVKLSNNLQDDEFMNAFIHHNYNFFSKCIFNGTKKIYMIGQNPRYPISKGNDQNVGIHYECGPHKWGSIGMMNKMIRRGYITIAKDHRNNCYCLNATAKLVNKILTEIWKKV